MPRGSFVIILPMDSDYKVLGYYFKTDEISHFKITGNLFLRLNLDHEKNDYNLLKLKDFKVLSFVHELKGKLALKASKIILGLFLREDEKPEKFRTSLKEAAETLESMELMDMNKETFEMKLREIYQEILEPLIDILDPVKVKEYIITRTKSLLSGGRKERKLAQELLEQVEDEDHEKISHYFKIAQKSLKSKDFEKAAKNYGKAGEYAQTLLGEDSDITKTLLERAQFSQKIPSLSKQRDKTVEDARNSLRNENFHGAYISYRKASELSKQLIQFDKEEEYRLKSNALRDFYQVDQKYKKKNS